jgi:glucose-6-phosphate 1-dehydrogenase
VSGSGKPALHAHWHLDPCTLVIFGVTGDLTHRKLAPALYDLSCNGLLEERFTVVGYGRKELDDQGLRDLMQRSVDDYYGSETINRDACKRVLTNPRYVRGEFDDTDGYARLRATLEQIERDCGSPANRIFYLATPPSLFPAIIHGLGQAGLGGRVASPGAIAAALAAMEPAAATSAAAVGSEAAASSEPARLGSAAAPPASAALDDDDLAWAEAVHESAGWTRIVIEKPFGSDLASARDLNKIVRAVFHERQVYRIDHYLAKETVQNILMFRFGNVIFEPVWNRRYVDHVQITAAETLGVEHRGPYYEESGALRDMIQNHLLQLLTLVAMEPPVAFSAEAVRDEKVKVLRAVRPLASAEIDRHAVRGQYADGVISGQAVLAYRQEERVSPQSNVETYAALKLFIDNWRWEGVPFYLRTGKRLRKHVTEIAIQFKRPPLLLFRQADLTLDKVQPNQLVLRIQPDEGISLRFQSKVPGEEVGLQPVEMDFSWGSALDELPFSAYETLLLDVMSGDATLFNRDDQVEESWRLVEPVLEAWQAAAGEIDTYEAGSWGPEAAVVLLAADGREWRRP